GNELVAICHMPENDVVVRLFDAGMTGIEVKIDTNNLAAWRFQILEFLVCVDVLDRDHINRAYEAVLVVVGEKWSCRQCAWIDVKRAKTGNEVGQLDERAHLLVGRRGRGLLDAAGSENRYCTEDERCQSG